MQTLKKRAVLYNIQITGKFDMHTMVLDEGSWDNIPDPTNIGRHCDMLMLKESPRNTAYFYMKIRKNKA